MTAERDALFAQQRLERGFDDSDTWSLDYTLAKFLLPRLKRFREITIGFPSSLTSMAEWQEILGKIEYSLELTILDMEGGMVGICDSRWEEGHLLLGKHFSSLWW